jgi:hypothetical protein
VVQAWLGPSVRLHKSDGQPDSREERSHAGARRNHQETSSQEADYSERIITPFEQGTARYSPEEIDEMYGHTNYQYVRPSRLALTVTFTNTSSRPITIAITEVDSLLGNFAARPENLTLAPGQQGSLDPMLSPIENNFDELDVMLTIRRGNKGETRVLQLRRAQGPPPLAPGNPRQD